MGWFRAHGHTGPGTAGLHASAQRLGPSSPRRLGRGEVPLPSTAALPCDTGSGWTRVLGPCSAGERGPCLGLAWGAARAAPCFGSCLRAGRPAGASCCRGSLCRAGSAGPQRTLARGHPLLQLHDFPQKPSLEEAAGGLGGVMGSVAFLVFGKTFFSPFVLLSRQPAAACTRDTLQLPVLMTFSLGDQLFTLPD